jgi:hypothetical protein
MRARRASASSSSRHNDYDIKSYAPHLPSSVIQYNVAADDSLCEISKFTRPFFPDAHFCCHRKMYLLRKTLLSCVLGGSQVGLWRHAGHSDGRFESCAARESFGHEPHRGAFISATVEGAVRLRPAHGPRQTRPDGAALPATCQPGQ